MLALAVGVGLIAALVVGLRALGRVNDAPTLAQAPSIVPFAGPSASPTATARPPQPTAPPTQQTNLPTRTPQATLNSSALAAVNEQVIAADTARVVLAADRAVGRLLGQPATDERDLLDRLVNTELVRQAAETAGFKLSDAQVTQVLTGFLAGRGKTQADLAAALAVEALSVADFQSYFGRLILVDQFTQAQAKAQGITVAAYLQRLQGAAHISFGPAAQAALSSLPTAAPSPAPAATVPATTAPPRPTVTAAVSRGVAIGQLAPEFDLLTLEGAAAKTIMAGRPVVLSFWTTWCPYCRKQTPLLVDAAVRHGSAGVQFFGIDVKEERPLVQDYVQANGIPYSIGLDTDGKVAEAYQVTGFPTTYFLDAAGRITARHVGQLSAEQIEGYLAALLVRGN